VKDLLAHLSTGQSLSLEQSTEAFSLIMDGQAQPAQIGALLAMIQVRGATVDELTGAATVMREKATHVTAPDGLTLVDTCGTGGDGLGTFNISTAAAIVTAGAGRPHNLAVAKHGNRSVTSNSGSSQVLETLGVKLQVTPETLTQCLDEAGMCFCFAPAHHPAMKHAAPVRAELGFRTIFNLVGPLTNPAGAKRQVLGVFAEPLTEMLGEVLLKLGSERAMVVHGKMPVGDANHVAGFDELSTAGPSTITELRGGQLHHQELDPDSLGLPFSHPSALKVEGPEQSAAVIQSVLAGEHGPARDIVCLNAAAALVVGDVATDLSEGLERAQSTIDAGKAKAALDQLIAITQAG